MERFLDMKRIREMRCTYNSHEILIPHLFNRNVVYETRNDSSWTGFLPKIDLLLVQNQKAMGDTASIEIPQCTASRHQGVFALGGYVVNKFYLQKYIS